MDENRDLRIGSIEIPLVRSKLREWLRLEDIRKDILDATEGRDGEKLIASLYSYVSVVSSISIDELMGCPWYEITRAYSKLTVINTPPDIPFIQPRHKKMQDESVGWDYPNRQFYLWANIIAAAYGWSLDYIAELDIYDALPLIQEILVDDQLQKEWEWGMSQNSYSYDATAKKSKFNPLKRPEWMNANKKVKEIPNVTIRSGEMPMGMILRWEDGKPSKPQ